MAYDSDTGAVVDAYPARTTFRGFVEGDEQEARRSLSVYLKNNAKELHDEVEWPEPKT